MNITFFSSHDLRYRLRPRPSMPCPRTSIRTPTALRLVYHFKPDVRPSKGAPVRRVASQRLTAGSGAPTLSVNSMPCFMACPACLARAQPLQLLSHVGLLPNSTPIALTGTISMIDSLSPHLIGGLLELFIQAGERAHDGPESRYAHRSLTQIHAASIRGPCRHVRRKNAAARISVLPTSLRPRL